jgi:hypothetical protein
MTEAAELPQRVQSDRGRQVRALRRGLESTQRVARIAWLAQLCCERVRIRLPQWAGPQPLSHLPGAHVAQTFSAVGESGMTRRDFAVWFRPQRARRPLGPRCHVLSVAWRRINVGPVEGQRCASSQAAVDQQREEWGKAAAFRSNEERAHLVRRQVGQPPCRLPWGVVRPGPGSALWPCRARPY